MNCHSKAWETPWKREEEVWRVIREWRAPKFHLLDSTQPLQSQHQPTLDHPILGMSTISPRSGRAHGALPLTDEHRPGLKLGKVKRLSCLPTAELFRLQSTTPNIQEHRWPWLKSGGHKTNLIELNMPKRFVRKSGHVKLWCRDERGWVWGWWACLMDGYESAKNK